MHNFLSCFFALCFSVECLLLIFVGLIGIAIAFWKLFTLYTMGVAVAKQAKSKTHDKSNPLGRVLAVGEEHMNKDIENRVLL